MLKLRHDLSKYKDAEGLALPQILRTPWLTRALTWLGSHLNFYRHLIYFTTVPFIASVILWASNGDNRIAWVDCLFMSFSALTVTGLNTVLLANLTVWQQTILFLLMSAGSLTIVSIVTLIVRIYFFRRRFRHLIATSSNARRRVNALARKSENRIEYADKSMDRPIDPQKGPIVADVLTDEPQDCSSSLPFEDSSDMPRAVTTLAIPRVQATSSATPPSPGSARQPRSRSTDFDEPLQRRERRGNGIPKSHGRLGPHAAALPPLSQSRQDSLHLRRVPARMGDSAMDSGFGGFPGPVRLTTFAAGALSRRITSRWPSDAPDSQMQPPEQSRSREMRRTDTTPYLTFQAKVGRNSRFKGLTTEQQEELGGVEYRALTILLRITIVYWLALQLLAVVAVAPYLAASRRWSSELAGPNSRSSSTWYSFFQIASAFGNVGLSLNDSSMIPFQEAYWLQIVLGFLILAGNTCYPIFLRLTIWTLSKLAGEGSRFSETLHFLLDHPRRCFLYLFPQHQTMLLVAVLFILNTIDWISFIVLDIGTPAIEAIASGTRAFIGLFQAVAVRSAGFAIVPISDIAPALQVLYLIMFQVAAYPLAISIRTTNTYEERSLGLYEDDADSEVEDDFEAKAKAGKNRVSSAYVGYHLRKQLAFDQWWWAFALFWLCILERAGILGGDTPWINVFAIIFELSSAYSNNGLSLGHGEGPTSLSGVFRPLSKVIMCIVMLRGRHRGLPNAIDRSVMLPDDLDDVADDAPQVIRDISLHSAPAEEHRATTAASLVP